MSVWKKYTILAFLLPLAAAVIIMGYDYQNRQAMMSELAKSGVSAIFENGNVSHEDIRQYFLHPPVEEDSLLQALEITPEDLADLDKEDASRLKEPTMQLLLSLMIQHIAVVKYLNQQPGDSSNKNYQDAVKMYKHSLMADRMEEELLRVEPVLKPEDMMQYYIKHRDEFYQDGKRLARHIALPANKEQENKEQDNKVTSEDILNRILDGEDFGHLILENSTSESQSRKGILGWHPKGALHQKMETVLWNMVVGEITGPIHINDFDHFFQLMDVQEKGYMDFESSKPLITEVLTEERRSNQVYEHLGISPSLIQAGNVESSLEYQTKLLERAYDMRLDEQADIVQQVNVYEMYKRADLLFDDYIKTYQKDAPKSVEPDTEWKQESQALQQLLDKMNFHYLVVFNLPEKDENTREPKE